MVPVRCNLREVSFSHLFPLDVARMHSCGYIHGDIHLNILIKLPSSFNHLSINQFYEEYGEPDCSHNAPRQNPTSSKHSSKHSTKSSNTAVSGHGQDAHVLLSDFVVFSVRIRRGDDCHTPLAMRPLEARFKPQAPLSDSADIWSLAVTIWEILGMKAIFSNEYITEDEMVSQHIDVLGPMPISWWERWEEHGEFFDQDRRQKEGREVWPELEQAFEQGVQSYRRRLEMGEFGREETRTILDLIRRMLAFQPEERPSIEQVLRSEWMVKWVLPDLERYRNSK